MNIIKCSSCDNVVNYENLGITDLPYELSFLPEGFSVSCNECHPHKSTSPFSGPASWPQEEYEATLAKKINLIHPECKFKDS